MRQVALVVLLGFVLVGCASQQKKVEEELSESPAVNCATAENDLKVLQDEKVSLVGKVGSGISMIAPVGLVVGILTGTQGTKFRVTTGKYNDMLDERITQIKQTCGL